MSKFPTPLANRKPVYIDKLEESDLPKFKRKVKEIAKQTGKSEEMIKSQFLWDKFLRLEDDPFEVLDDIGHNCLQEGHIMIMDWDREIDWNEFYILIPKKCRVCGARSLRVFSLSDGAFVENY